MFIYLFTAQGTEIWLSLYQLEVLDYWAQASQTAQVGISIAEGQQQIECWLPIQLDPIADEPLQRSSAALNAKWQESIAGLAPLVAQYRVGQEIECVFKMRYLSNTLRAWLTQRVC
jgi:hypothetical protein